VSIYPQALEALARISLKPFKIVIVTNQSAVGRGLISLRQVKPSTSSWWKNRGSWGKNRWRLHVPTCQTINVTAASPGPDYCCNRPDALASIWLARSWSATR
jgi:hypothetical protein